MVADIVLTFLTGMVRRLRTEERGAVGWLILGIVLGIAVVIFAIIKFLIPGE